MAEGILALMILSAAVFFEQEQIHHFQLQQRRLMQDGQSLQEQKIQLIQKWQQVKPPTTELHHD